MKLQIGWGIYDFASLDLDLGLVFVVLFVTIEWEPESDCRHTHHENEKYISCLYTIYRIRMWWWVAYFRFSVFFVIRIFGFTSGNQFLKELKNTLRMSCIGITWGCRRRNGRVPSEKHGVVFQFWRTNIQIALSCGFYGRNVMSSSLVG